MEPIMNSWPKYRCTRSRPQTGFGLQPQKEYGSGGTDPFNTKATILGETDLVHVWSAMWTWLMSNNSFFELKYSGYYSPNDYLPAFPKEISITRPIMMEPLEYILRVRFGPGIIGCLGIRSTPLSPISPKTFSAVIMNSMGSNSIEAGTTHTVAMAGKVLL